MRGVAGLRRRRVSAHADGIHRAEIRRYYRKDGGAKEQGPYWCVCYHEGGKQKEIYLGRTDKPDDERARR